VRFDPDTLVVGGQSLGSYLAGMLAGLLPDWKGVILTGAGGSWVEFPFGPTDPIMPAKIIDIAALPPGEHIDLWHPLVMAFDLALGPSDNTHYVEKVLRYPLPGHNVPHALVVEGHGDIQVPDHLQRALVLALGVDLAGGEVPNIPATEQIVPALPWGGLKELAYPAGGNRNGKTAIVVRYERDIREGHYVSFQLDEPKRQIADFLSDIAAGKTPIVK
jgi:pimeloyl-ACP methyl ester carboxylesterase